ncbi:tripartite tricarboxylate transporter substrate binding protein [Limnohabitans sp. Rim8]|jgi:tripartite-type tricarboxylate transporter receptor subunit TctC|uniref:Bug family tripartite tricarboxylate transporter substrate binding protein n=1 Tax=Limnohabitans sp. Rim8 TaxID=1100718 RepID=UPI0026010ED6|nr:tripartite tricarboxylate transporter substrate binding protein [Limnohabitans sp. Rim8]
MNKFVALVLTALYLCGAALAQTPLFPTKPIRLVVAYPPGGSADVLSRAIAEGVSQRLGQRVVVENKPGANGNIAADLVAKSPADGYTLLMTAPGPVAVNASLYASLPFDPATAFAPVSLAGVAPLLLVVPANLPVRNLKELLDYLKVNPTKATFASQGNASSGHLAMELLKVRTGMQATHVPYKGSAPALNDLLAGHVTMMFDNTTSSLPLVRAGTLRAIAVAEEKRLIASPDIPTVAEQGLPGFVSTPWFGVVTTAGTPNAIVEKLSAAINETLRTPAAQVRFHEIGVELRPNSPQAFERYISAETVKWKEVVRLSGAKLD